MAEKRKHAVFAQDESVHPSRRIAVDGPKAVVPGVVAEPKTKTAAKQRYLKKKARKHKVLVAARKASAPKHKQAVSTHDGSGDEGTGPDSGDEGGEGKLEVVDLAGPSKPRVRIVLPPKDGEQAEDEEDAAAARERKKAEKREKRANRHKEPTAPVAEATEPAETTEMEVDGEEEADGPDPALRSPTPPMLEPFPLPTSAPAPKASVLNRQGLPAGLENATFVDQDTKAPIEGFVKPDGKPYLSERMKGRLGAMGLTDFFAVQSAMLPPLLSEDLLPLSTPSDYLVSAPTGSGKTLAYCIPLIETLSRRQVIRLRALIVLPTRELVTQVKEVLESLAKGTGLKIAAISGQQSFAHEQSQLVPVSSQKLLGGSSSVDILVATPGRLIDHVNSTPNFSLQHLRFLVIDEADRLLNQSFQSWLSHVSSHIYPPAQPIQLDSPPQPWDAIAPAWMETYGLTDKENPFRERPSSPCQKLLFSATLTRDPSKIAALSLRTPSYFIVQSSSHPSGIAAIGEHFAVPTNLVEKMIVMPPALKPLNLIHLLYAFGVRNALVFTKSVDAAVRLETLLTFFGEAWTGVKLVARSYTAEMKPGERKRVMEEFAAGKIDLLICSDVVARGIDLPTTASVISYDVPLDMRKYVHRVGRTARAGREGTAWTLIEKQEARRFKGILKGASHEQNVKKVKVKEEDLEQYQESYKIAMERFSEHYSKA